MAQPAVREPPRLVLGAVFSNEHARDGVLAGCKRSRINIKSNDGTCGRIPVGPHRHDLISQTFRYRYHERAAAARRLDDNLFSNTSSEDVSNEVEYHIDDPAPRIDDSVFANGHKRSLSNSSNKFRSESIFPQCADNNATRSWCGGYSRKPSSAVL